MENFKKTLKKRFIAYTTLVALMLAVNVVLIILNAFDILIPVTTSMGSVFGATMGACVVLFKRATDAKKALKDEKKFEKLYVANTDERILFIEKSTSNLTTNIFLVILGITAIIFSYINETIYYTLFYVLILYIVIMLICNLYYNKRY